MSELSFYSIDSFLGWLKGTAFPAAPGTVYLALFNGDPDQNGTEVTTLVNASGRQAITFGSIVHHQITTTALIDFGNAANATTVSWLAVFDAVSGGNCLTRRALAAPVTIASGQDVKVNIADLTIRLTRLQDKITLVTHIPTTKVIFLTTTGAGTWTVPSDWNNSNNTIECIGGGGSSSDITSVLYQAGGGGGGYSAIANLNLTIGSTINYSVGAGGPSAAFNAQGVSGGDTWFNATREESLA
jgi:hypothetical protein